MTQNALENKKLEMEQMKDETNRRGQDLKFLTDGAKSLTTIIGKKNDFGWYNLIPTLIELAGRIQWADPNGRRFPAGLRPSSATMRLPESGAVVNMPVTGSVPSYAVLNYVPSIGINVEAGLSANLQVATTMFDYLTSVLGRTSYVYSPADVQAYVVAVVEAIADTAEVVRILKAIHNDNAYTVENGRKLVSALCNRVVTRSEYVNLIGEKNKYVNRVNRILTDLSVLWIPSDLAYLNRRIWLASAIYADEDTRKSQFYVFRRTVSYKFNEETGELEAQDRSVINSLDTLLSQIELEVYALMTSTNIGTLRADILKAFGKPNGSGIAKIELDPCEEKVPVIYSPDILNEIQNASLNMLDVSTYYVNWNIKQSSDGTHLFHGNLDKVGLFISPVPSSVGVHPLASAPYEIISAHVDNPDLPLTVDITRLVTWTSTQTPEGGTAGLYITVCNSEIIGYVSVWYNDIEDDTLLHRADMASAHAILAASDAAVAGFGMQNNSRLALVSHWDWFPKIKGKMTIGNNDPIILPFAGEISNYALVSESQISALAYVCSLSLFYHPTPVDNLAADIPVMGAKFSNRPEDGVVKGANSNSQSDRKPSKRRNNNKKK